MLTQEEILYMRKELAAEELEEAERRADLLRAQYEELRKRSEETWQDWTQANKDSMRLFRQWNQAAYQWLYFPPTYWARPAVIYPLLQSTDIEFSV